MKKLFCLLLSLMLLSCAAYAEDAEQSRAPFEYELTDGVLTLRVDANPSTGYDWDYESEDEYAEMITCEYVGESDMPGAPGQYAISFRAVPGSAGDAAIILTERAPDGTKSAQLLVSARAEADELFVDAIDYYAVDEESVLTVYLVENASTGYAWTNVIEDTRCLRLVSEEHIGPESDLMVGMPGVYKAVFESTMESAGATALVFTYAQAWDGGATDRTVSFDVWTTEAGTLTVDEVAMNAE